MKVHELQDMHADREKVSEVLGKSRVLDEAETFAAIRQFAPRTGEKKVKDVKVAGSYFYQVDPDNTLIVCFDEDGRMTAAIFGGQ